jgi:hypothetical protein
VDDAATTSDRSVTCRVIAAICVLIALYPLLGMTGALTLPGANSFYRAIGGPVVAIFVSIFLLPSFAAVAALAATSRLTFRRCTLVAVATAAVVPLAEQMSYALVESNASWVPDTARVLYPLTVWFAAYVATRTVFQLPPVRSLLVAVAGPTMAYWMEVLTGPNF